jgi:hypothetical protein
MAGIVGEINSVSLKDTFMSGLMEVLSAEPLGRHGNCENFPLNFHFLNRDVFQEGNIIHMYVGVCGFCAVRCIIITGFYF